MCIPNARVYFNWEFENIRTVWNACKHILLLHTHTNTTVDLSLGKYLQIQKKIHTEKTFVHCAALCHVSRIDVTFMFEKFQFVPIFRTTERQRQKEREWIFEVSNWHNDELSKSLRENQNITYTSAMTLQTCSPAHEHAYYRIERGSNIVSFFSMYVYIRMRILTIHFYTRTYKPHHTQRNTHVKKKTPKRLKLVSVCERAMCSKK